MRESGGRDRAPSAAVIDSQVVKTTPVGGPERGYDGAKRLAGRKRHILVDTGGLVLAAKVHGADLPDRDGGRRLLEDGEELPRMVLLWADGAYTGGFREWLRRRLGWRLEVPHHPVSDTERRELKTWARRTKAAFAGAMLFVLLNGVLLIVTNPAPLWLGWLGLGVGIIVVVIGLAIHFSGRCPRCGYIIGFQSPLLLPYRCERCKTPFR